MCVKILTLYHIIIGTAKNKEKWLLQLGKRNQKFYQTIWGQRNSIKGLGEVHTDRTYIIRITELYFIFLLS